MEINDQFGLVKDYLEEASEFLDAYEGLLLQLEQEEDLDPGVVAEILGVLHTFKGNSGMMGYLGVQTYAHKLEDLFKALQAGRAEFDRECIEFIMHSVSILRKTVARISPKKPAEPVIQKDIEQLDRFLHEVVRTAPGSAGTNCSLIRV